MIAKQLHLVQYSCLPSLRTWQSHSGCLCHQSCIIGVRHAKRQRFLQYHPGIARASIHLHTASNKDQVEQNGAIAAPGVALEVSHVSKAFGDHQVLSDVCLEVPRGSFHMLVGPNGCGKSTLLRTLGGLMKADRGMCHVLPPAGFVFQNPDHQVVMPTVGADVAFGLGRYKLKEAHVRAHVERMLEAVNLAGFARRQTHTLSGGQKQRVAIAGALAECPKVLLLDELTTFLDGEDQKGVLEAVRNCVGGPDEVTALWVTHRLEELEWADRVSYMDNGKIQFTGLPREAMVYLKRLGAHV